MSSVHEPFKATRGDLLRRCGLNADAVAAYERAAELTDNAAEREPLEQRVWSW